MQRATNPTRRLIAALVLFSVSACDERAIEATKKPAAGLTREQAQGVLAKVGDKVITVGDFATALERMNEVDRLRFQSPKRRQELLQELIDTELLAQEARKRGLDKEPAVEEAVRQILRDAMRAKARQGLPAPAEISQGEVASYYADHASEFTEPERRRVSAILLGDPDKALEVLKKARGDAKAKDAGAKKGGASWGDLYFEHSLDAPKERAPGAPADLAGDLGIVGPVDHPKGKSDRVPEAVQRAVFALENIGDVSSEPVKVGEKYFVVRLSGMSKAHTRTLAEAERAIRIAILQAKLAEREAALEADLKKRFPIHIDEQALAAVALPKGVEAANLWQDQPGDLAATQEAGMPAAGMPNAGSVPATATATPSAAAHEEPRDPGHR